jgi:hypothetical protein
VLAVESSMELFVLEIPPALMNKVWRYGGGTIEQQQ